MVSYHVVTTEGLHHGGFVEELDPLPQAGRFIHRLDSYTSVRVSFNNVLGNSLIHHSKGALTQFSHHHNLLPGNLPFIWNIDYRNRRLLLL